MSFVLERDGASWSGCEKRQHTSFEHAITDRQHVVAIWNVERLRVWDERGQRLRRTCDRILGANRDQGGNAESARLLAIKRLPRAADTGGKRLQIGFGLFGKG